MERRKIFWIALLVVGCITTPLALSGATVTSGTASISQKAEGYSAALESQITCAQFLDPAKAIGSLQRAGVIEQRLYLNYDSLNYFRVRKPLVVWGLRVVSVFGFDHNERIFERGPGTAPPVELGVVVPYPVARVKSKLSRLGLQNVKVQRAAELDIPPRRGRSRALTEIYCEDDNR
jgi:hypothetical protein